MANPARLIFISIASSHTFHHNSFLVEMQRPNNQQQRRYRFPSLHDLFPSSPHWTSRIPERHRRKQVLLDHTREYNRTLIHNLSTHHLSEEEINVLAKGLNFSPNMPFFKRSSDPTEVINDLKKRINTTLYFDQLPIQNADTQDQPLPKKLPSKGPSTWNPPNTDHPNVNLFFDQLESLEIQPFEHHNDNNNHFLKSFRKLKNNHDIVIKKADKGGGIVILNKNDYIQKILTEHLNDRITYRTIDYDPTPHITRDVNSMIQYLHSKHYIDDHTAKYLQPNNPPRTPIFHGLPKIHKPNIPLRPIVSGFDSPTDNLSRYIAHYLQPLVENLPSYIKNTKHMLQILDSFDDLPDNIIMVTADVRSLYTSIPHDDGLESVTRHYNQFQNLLPAQAPNITTIRILLEFILIAISVFKKLTTSKTLALQWEDVMHPNTPTFLWGT